MVYTVEELRRIITPIAVKYGLPAVYLFGSYARGTAKESSDVDLLIDTAGTSIKTLLDLGAVYCDLEDALGKSVDLLTLSAFTQRAQMPSEAAFRQAVQEERKVLYAAA